SDLGKRAGRRQPVRRGDERQHRAEPDRHGRERHRTARRDRTNLSAADRAENRRCRGSARRRDHEPATMCANQRFWVRSRVRSDGLVLARVGERGAVPASQRERRTNEPILERTPRATPQTIALPISTIIATIKTVIATPIPIHSTLPRSGEPKPASTVAFESEGLLRSSLLLSPRATHCVAVIPT